MSIRRMALFLVAVAISCMAVPSAVALAAVSAVGRTAGEGDVSASGEASYVIPITVPPGINGLTPELAMVYGHRQSEGIAGVGWGISGLSEITRCGKTYAQDGVTKNVELSTSDRFCVDGVQLRLTSGTYGTSGSQYRSEVDNISKYIAGGTAGNGPAYFTVKSKNGLTYEYGMTADSRIESLASGWTTTAITWALNKIRDGDGNEILFKYIEDGAPYGSHRIDYITYRSNPGQGISPAYKIEFLYENQPADDDDTAYASGGKIEDIKRLYRINVLYTETTPETVVRLYHLEYEDLLSSANRSRLELVRECAGYPLECLSDTSFSYQNGTNGLDSEVSTGTTIPAGAKAFPLDINGDGRTDFAFAASSGKWAYRLANATGGYEPLFTTTISTTGHAEAIIIDHNSDGMEDLLVPYSGGTWWAIHGSSGGLLSPVDTGAPDWSTAGNAAALDMNGDGRDDLVWRHGANVVYARYRNATGNEFSSTITTVLQLSNDEDFANPTLFTGAYEQNRHKYFDANGDGIRDLAIVTVTYGGTIWEPIEFYWTDIILGGGAGVFSVLADTSVGLPIDINGDGYTDIAYRTYSGPLLYRLSTGKSFGPKLTGQSLANLNFNRAVAMDWNNDGMQDLLIPNTSTGTWFYLRSIGESFETGVDTNLAWSGTAVTATFIVDIDGDGLQDVSYLQTVAGNSVYAYRRHSGVMPDLMTTATDGNDNSITFNYAPITQSSYTVGTGATFPNQDYIGPLHVVTSTIASTGLGTGTYTTTYTYEKALFHVQGRGLSPFESVTAQDSRNGIKVKESFRRDFPYRGRLSSRKILQEDDTPIQEQIYTWAAKSIGSAYQKYHFPYISQVVEKNYEAEGPYKGAQIDEATTSITVDNYGTPTTIETTTTEKSTANGAQPAASYTEKIVHSSINNDTMFWCLGKPGQTQWINSHTQDATYGAQITRTVTRAWDTSANCRVTQEITEPASTSYKVTRALGYDAFGNISSETITGAGMTSRVTSTYWGTTGQFPLTVTNPLGHVTSMTWNLAHGTKSSQTDPNGLTVSWLYDFFGRRTRATRVDGTYTEFTLTDCNAANSYCGTSYDPVLTRIRASVRKTNGTEIRVNDTYLDKADRPIQFEQQSMAGTMSRVRTVYDSLGRISQRSMPSFSASPPFYTTIAYDLLNRPEQISRPINATDPTLQYTSIAYNGLTTITTDAELKQSTKIRDVLGRIFRSIDHDGYYQQFDFDAFGSLRRVYDGSNALLQATYAYGIRPFRLTSNDMDMGFWTYTPNALGEVVAYIDAKSQNFSATYDKLSRPLLRTEPDNTTEWIWGSSSAAHNIGRLSSISTGAHSESYAYDSKGRISQRTTVADATYLTNYAYDSTSGQLDLLQYPVSTSGYRLKLKYAYAYGILQSVSDFNVPATVFWQADAADARGNVIQETLENGLETNLDIDEVTGLPSYIQSGPGGATTRQNLAFLWNKVGSLRQREDLNRSLVEDFDYDNLHRLDRSELNGVQNLDLAYDAMGNIAKKTDVHPTSTWTYHATKKHAVITAGSHSFSYDANGNQITRDGDPVSWTSYNYPSRIENGSRAHDYYYDGHRRRWKQVYTNGTATETTVFVGGIMEKRSEGSYSEYRHYIKVGDRAVALYTRPTSGTIETRYLLYDHQGSVAEITDSAGGFDVSESFGAYGERRDPVDWDGPIGAGDEAAIAAATPRGYTFHTNLAASSLVHMNGRVADGLTGRFLSPDPYVSYAGNTQSYNRYSYVHNNPLTYSDPSGFTLEFDWLDNDGGAILSFIWAGRSKQGQTAPAPIKGCFVPSASACYGKAGSSRLFDIVFDVLIGPMPSYGQYDELVLYYTDPNGFGRFENEIILIEDIATGVFYEFILMPIEAAMEGKLLAAACNIAKLCRIAERYGGKIIEYVAEQGNRYLRRKVSKVPNRPTVGGGGTLDKLSPSEQARIQNAANRSGQYIGVVGSRVNPDKALRPDSDYDFVIDANNSTRNSLSRSLPGAKDVKQGLPSNNDVFKGPVDPELPHVIFHPE